MAAMDILGDTEADKAKLVHPQKLFVSVDIESKGCRLRDHVLQIGVAYATETELETMEKEGKYSGLRTRSFCFDLANDEFEERCKTEFWTKYEDVYKRITSQAGTVGPTWLAFVEFWDGLEKLADDMTLLSDNPLFDLGKIDKELADGKYREFGVRHTSTGQYRGVKDPSERIKGLSLSEQTRIRDEANRRSPATHWAPDDASNIMWQYWLVHQAIKRREAIESRLVIHDHTSKTV